MQPQSDWHTSIWIRVNYRRSQKNNSVSYYRSYGLLEGPRTRESSLCLAMFSYLCKGVRLYMAARHST